MIATAFSKTSSKQLKNSIDLFMHSFSPTNRNAFWWTLLLPLVISIALSVRWAHGVEKPGNMLYIADLQAPQPPQHFRTMHSVEGRINMLYNSSFEITTTPDIPDGWSRDFWLPPWGEQVYSIDRTDSYHGKNSLRLGHVGKYAQSWRSHTKVFPGKRYTLSVYLKAERDNAKASISIDNIGSRTILVNTEWNRHHLSGLAKAADTSAMIRLESMSVLWIDAVQLEEGPEPTVYLPGKEDDDDQEKILDGHYRDLYRYCRHTFPDYHGKSDKNDAGFHLIGTEYDFYMTEPFAHARCRADGYVASKMFWHIEKNGMALSAPNPLVLKNGINEWKIDIGELPIGVYDLVAVVKTPGTGNNEQRASFRKLAPQKNHVRINRWGRHLVVNDEPYLFFGFYDNLNHGTSNRWELAVKEMSRGNCNGAIVYTGGTKEYDMLDEALNHAYRNGQKMWVHFGWLLSSFLPKYANRADRFTDEAQALAKLREVILKHRQHPALLGWATLDEPDNRPGIFTKERINGYYRLIKELDPYHPCIISHLSLLRSSSVYGEATDIAVIPYSGHRYHDDLFAEYWRLGIPVFTNPPCIGGLRVAGREPTPAEQRVRLYKGLVMGSRGLCSYTFRSNSQSTWEEMAQVGRELKTIGPILLSDGQALHLPTILDENESVTTLFKAFDNERIVIAVNSGNSKADVVLRLKDIPAIDSIQGLFHSPDHFFDNRNKALYFSMPEMSVAIYRLL
jgi:hypothetical protein